MKQNINIEAESNELILKNKAGDYVIIPKIYRREVQDMIKENCHGCIDKLVETLPIMEDYAPDGSVIPSWMNYKNWGVTDYTDKGDFDTAYSTARKDGKDEFLFNNKRYSTKMNPVAGDIVQKREDFKGNKLSDVLIYDYANWKQRDKEFDDLYRYYAGRPLNDNYLQYSKYKPTITKENNNIQYISINNEDYKDKLFNQGNILFDTNEKYYDADEKINENTYRTYLNTSSGAGFLSKGEDDRGRYYSYYDKFDAKTGNKKVSIDSTPDVIGISKPFEIYDRIYYKDYNGKKKRMYYSDKELSELNVDKKNFDTLALQRELSNRGYKLPKSTKKDGTFDGIWGDETKNALLEYKKSQNKLGQ